MLTKIFIFLLTASFLSVLLTWIIANIFCLTPILYDKIISAPVNGKMQRFGIKIYYNEKSTFINVYKTIRHTKFSFSTRFLDSEIDYFTISNENISMQTIENKIQEIIQCYETEKKNSNKRNEVLKDYLKKN